VGGKNDRDFEIGSVDHRGVRARYNFGHARTGAHRCGVNYQQVALLKWYPAGQAAAFGVGSQP